MSHYTPLYDSICTSARMADLPDDACRLFYTWLLAKCDSWGRHDARPRKLNACVWPLLGRSDEETARCLEALRGAGLVEVYQPSGSDPFVQVPDWEEKAGTVGRQSHRRVSRFPAPEGLPAFSGPLSGLPGPGVPRARASGAGDRAGAPAGGESEGGRKAPDGGPGPKPSRKPATGPAADCQRWWESEWARTRLGLEWSWTAREASSVAKAVKLASGDAQEVQRRMTRLLEHGDAWMAENACPHLLVDRWNHLAVDVVPRARKSNADLAIEDFERRGGTFDGFVAGPERPNLGARA